MRCTFSVRIYIEYTKVITTYCVTLINLKLGMCFYIITKCTSRHGRHAYAKDTLAVDFNLNMTRPLLIFARISS